MTEYPQSVFLDAHPAQLCCGDWRSDTSFLKILKASWLAQYAEYMGEAKASSYLDKLEREQRLFSHYDPLTIHAKVDQRIVGVAALRPLGKINLVTLLEVHPDLQCRGIGSQLLQALCIVSPRVMAHVSIHRPSVKKFYASQGFHLLKRDIVEHDSYQLPFDVLAR